MYLFILLLFITILNLSCSKKIFDGTTKEKGLQCKKYKVEKIYEEGTIYIIELSINDSVFRVLTIHHKNPKEIYLAENKNEDCHNQIIKVGKSYSLKLDSLYKYKKEKDFVYTFDVHHYIEFNGSNVEIKQNETLFTTKNLRGLCILP